jgi:2-(3-amino-3-carboxypropyl)histidine synthase
MKCGSYDLDFSNVLKTTKQKGYKQVLIQIPEGLKQKSFEIVSFLEKERSLFCIIQADPCFGACDIPPDCLTKDLNVDAIIHIGHQRIPSISKKGQQTPILYVPARSIHPIKDIIQDALPLLEGTRIGICTTAQHIHQLESVSKILEDNGFKPILGPGDPRIDKNSQILGCNFSVGRNIQHEVDSFLYIGSGMFHPLGLSLSVNKPVIILDPYTRQVKKEELMELKESVLRQRYGAIAQAKQAESFGILLGSKKGQMRLHQAHKSYQMIIDENKKAWLILVNHLTPSFLEGYYTIDCFISTLCPRIAIDDYLSFKTPIITPKELEIALGKTSWDEYQFDEIIDE